MKIGTSETTSSILIAAFRSLKKRKREIKGLKNLFEKLMAENFPNLVKGTKIKSWNTVSPKDKSKKLTSQDTL